MNVAACQTYKDFPFWQCKVETLLRRRTSGATSSDFFKGCLHEIRNALDPRRNLNAP